MIAASLGAQHVVSSAWLLLALVIAVVALVAIVVLSVLLVRERRRYAAVVASIQPRPESGMRHGAQTAVQIAVQTAARLRRGGVGGMLVASLDDLARWASEDRAQLVRVAAADGTVTFMFTDIENSTALNEEVGDKAWMRILDAHDRMIRAAVSLRGGHVVKSQGDGFMIAFGEPDRAIATAIDIQRSPAGRARGPRRAPIAVRIGIHRGVAVSRDGDYFGRTVAMAARVAAEANGGEILVSADTLDALPDSASFEFGAPRRVALKGLSGEHTLHPVESRSAVST